MSFCVADGVKPKVSYLHFSREKDVLLTQIEHSFQRKKKQKQNTLEK